MRQRRVLSLRMRRRARLPVATAVLAFATVLALSGWVPGRSPVTGTPAAAATCNPGHGCATPRPTDKPTPCDSALPYPPYYTPCAATPTPDVIVISPVPADPPPPQRTPAYLIGLPATPSAGPADVGGGVASLGGGSDTPPSPGGGGGGGAQSTEQLKSTGLPLPFLFAMLMLASIGAGFVIYRFGPRGRRLPTVRPATPMLFTPYGGQSRTTANLLDPNVNQTPD
jgi:hypothetical protein